MPDAMSNGGYGDSYDAKNDEGMCMKRPKKRRQDDRDDAAERWLRENDPQYSESRKAWTTPTTDALCHAISLDEILEPLGEKEFISGEHNPLFDPLIRDPRTLPQATSLYDTRDYETKSKPGRTGYAERRRSLMPLIHKMMAFGLTQTYISELLGIPQQTISDWLKAATDNGALKGKGERK